MKPEKNKVHFICTFNKKMENSKLNHDNPKSLENKRLAEIKKLSYIERLERLSALIKISYMLKSAKRLETKNRWPNKLIRFFLYFLNLKSDI